MPASRLFTRDFTLMTVGQIISLFGNAILRVALSLHVLALTGSAAVFGGMGMIAFPALLYGFWLSSVMSFEIFGLLVCIVLAFGCLLMHRYLGRGGLRRFRAL